MDTRCNFSRDRQLQQLDSDDEVWDLVVVGGGATGLGVAVDAATRGYRVVLFEQHDFGKGTSSRSTKLIHGGLRYLAQGRVGLVRDALHERGLLCKNAPHLVRPLPTLVPLYSAWEGVYYRLGLKVYDWLSGRWNLEPSRRLSVDQAIARVPTLEPMGLHGGVMYFDGAFDDARLLVNLVQTAIESGAVCVNYAPVQAIVKESGRVSGVIAEDAETGKTFRVRARVVVNAAGPFSDQVRRLDDPQAQRSIVPSQGIHIVFESDFMPGDTALIVPKTRDGRVVFAIPWHDRVVVGTTDTAIDDVSLEPRARPSEIEFLLETISPYWSHKPSAADIRAVFAGIRPLVCQPGSRKTSQLGRDHMIDISPSGLVSIIGGKWTTFRKMAEDCVDRAAALAGLLPTPCRTKTLPIHGSTASRLAGTLAIYGSDGAAVEQLGAERREWSQRLDNRLPYLAGQVLWAARHEMARTVEDVLARRLRALFLDAEAACSAAPSVAALLAGELGRDATWQADQIERFNGVARAYRVPNDNAT
jgi:glycerol-3-phosphate dehydrogenase